MKVINIKPDSVRDKEAMNLMKMVDIALKNYNLETCLGTKEQPLMKTTLMIIPTRNIGLI